jgi:hypothetical protein
MTQSADQVAALNSKEKRRLATQKITLFLALVLTPTSLEFKTA